MKATWRGEFAPTIAGIIAAHPSRGRDLKRALNEARKRHCREASWLNRVWRDEVNVQLGLKRPADERATAARKHKPAPGQLELL